MTPETISSVQPRFLSRRRATACTAVYAILFSVSLLASFALAYNFTGALADGPRDPHGTHYGWLTDLYLPVLTLALPIKLLVFALMRQFRTSWRYVGLHDLFSVSFAALLSSNALILAYFAVENVSYQTRGAPLIDFATPRLHQSVFMLDFGLTIGLVCAARVLVRFYYEDVAGRRAPAGESRRVLLVGTGDQAEALLREARRLGRTSGRVVGLVSEGGAGHPASIHGVDVVGRADELADLVRRHEADEVWIALPNVSPRRARAWVEQCDGTGVRFRSIPALSDLLSGRLQVSQLRDIQIEDLLGREPVRLNSEQVASKVRGRRVAVTGAGGSIGSELCRQIARFQPERLILIEQAENALFRIDRELREQARETPVSACIADVTDRARMDALLRLERPAIVFHAAAHKHVPMMEINPGEAVKNNVGGTCVTADACLAAGVERMVLVSTDKAVNPTSVMGCTKRVAELYVQALNQRRRTHFVTVRFGNVLGSDGSVVPVFREQIARGGPVTVTHSDMRRYFMTIPEAAQLVLQAGAMGEGGEIFMLEMGEPVRIVDLARNMIRLSGLRPDLDIEIQFTGLRPGEKLFEELSIDGESVRPTSHPQIGILRHREEDWTTVEANVLSLLEIPDEADPVRLRAALEATVPEYAPAPQTARL